MFMIIHNQIDPETAVSHFSNEYYLGVSSSGWNTVQHLFDHSCSVIFRDKVIGNEHNLLNLLSSDFIRGAKYPVIRSKWIVLDSNRILLNVFGTMQFINSYGFSLPTMPFTESFILVLNNNRISCTHHIFDY